jgi:hypothetical protein
MPVPPEALEALETFCRERTPEHLRDQVRLDVTQKGNRLVVWDCRAPWSGKGVDRMECAELSFDDEYGTWTLRWPKAGGGWHPYPQLPPTGQFSRVLQELDEDPCSCFWG